MKAIHNQVHTAEYIFDNNSAISLDSCNRAAQFSFLLRLCFEARFLTLYMNSISKNVIFRISNPQKIDLKTHSLIKVSRSMSKNGWLASDGRGSVCKNSAKSGANA